MTTKGILGRKVGMTQVFTENGELIPVTVIEATPNVVLQVKTLENDGYNAVQLGYQDKRAVLSNKPEQGHVAKANTAPKRYIREIRDAEGEFNVGDEVKVDIFAAGEFVDVIGISRGKGFAGTIKRWNHQRGPESHGSKNHRQTASLGARMSGGGGKVFKGKKMPGQLGGDRVTVQNLEVVRVDTDRSILLVKGGIPGAKGSLVMVKTAVKSSK